MTEAVFRDQNVTLSWRVDAAFLRAWPALATQTRGEWQARFANGVSLRSNSVNPLGSNAVFTEEDLQFFHEAYAAKNQPLIVRVPTLLDVRADEILTREGFSAERECCVLCGPIEATRSDADVEIVGAPPREWLDAMHEAQQRKNDQRVKYEAMFNAVTLPAGFATLRVNAEPVALAYGAIADDLLCIESVVTFVHQRGKGYAKHLIAALLHWAKAGGARTASLQVEVSNAPALALYRKIGLSTELYRYHYRRQGST
jgi:ribosomal protein S18 acetylase RimI-like enzyme